jgi:hypothetical protein
VTGQKKDRREAEIRHEEKGAEIDEIIAKPTLAAG